MIVEKKKRSILRNVSIRIEPSKGEAYCYTIYKPHAVNTNLAQEPINDRLNHKYKEMLRGWLAEKRQCENEVFDKVGVIKKHSMKIKAERSILKRKSATRK